MTKSVIPMKQKKELKAIFEGIIPFDTPKPIRLLERIIQIGSNNKGIVLDFLLVAAQQDMLL